MTVVNFYLYMLICFAPNETKSTPYLLYTWYV